MIKNQSFALEKKSFIFLSFLIQGFSPDFGLILKTLETTIICTFQRYYSFRIENVLALTMKHMHLNSYKAEVNHQSVGGLVEGGAEQLTHHHKIETGW